MNTPLFIFALCCGTIGISVGLVGIAFGLKGFPEIPVTYERMNYLKSIGACEDHKEYESGNETLVKECNYISFHSDELTNAVNEKREQIQANITRLYFEEMGFNDKILAVKEKCKNLPLGSSSITDLILCVDFTQKYAEILK